jgi:hypothetical protein
MIPSFAKCGCFEAINGIMKRPKKILSIFFDVKCHIPLKNHVPKS